MLEAGRTIGTGPAECTGQATYDHGIWDYQQMTDNIRNMLFLQFGTGYLRTSQSNLKQL